MPRVFIPETITKFEIICDCGYQEVVNISITEHSERVFTCYLCMNEYYMQRISPSQITLTEKIIVRQNLKEYVSKAILEQCSPMEQRQFGKEVEKVRKLAREQWQMGRYPNAIATLCKLPYWVSRPIFQEMGAHL